MTGDRAARALLDVVRITRTAPGMATVTTWRGSYTVDARDGACTCKDFAYNLDGGTIKRTDP